MVEQLAAMPGYEAYKDSGVEWLGKIPAHWEIKRLKYVVNINRETLPETTPSTFEMKYVDIGSVSYEKGIEKTEYFMFKSSPSRARRLAQAGDTIISTVRTYLRAIDYIDECKNKFVYSTGFSVLSPKHINSKFLTSFVWSNAFTNQVEDESKGISYPAINSTDLSNLFFVEPPLPEQTAIAAFLDCKTAQVDQAVAIKEKQIALLKERKQILIQNAVTRGLNPGAPMSDSGVEWIGEIPAHWEIMANRALFKERIEPGEDGLPLLSVSIHTAVSSEEIPEDENIRGRIKIEDKSKYNLVQPGDIVFNMMRAWQGAIGAVKVRGMVSPAYIIATPCERIVPDYFEYQYRCPEFIQQMDRNSKGITDFRKRLYWGEFKQLLTVDPPIEEQVAIVAHIETESAKIDQAISIQQQQIDKLKEYKATLINSAVTGKIRVSMPVEGKKFV